MIKFSVDFSKVSAGLNLFNKKIDENKQKALMKVGFEIMRLSSFEVPHDKGTLQNSGNVEPIGDNVVIGYHTPYAARLHEHPEYHFQKGRKGKYLSDPIVKNQRALGLNVGSELKGTVKNV